MVASQSTVPPTAIAMLDKSCQKSATLEKVISSAVGRQARARTHGELAKDTGIKTDRLDPKAERGRGEPTRNRIVRQRDWAQSELQELDEH